MYQIKRNGRTLSKIGTHPSYEKARQAARRYLRRIMTTEQYEVLGGMWDHISRNPTSLKAANLRIVKVA